MQLVLLLLLWGQPPKAADFPEELVRFDPKAPIVFRAEPGKWDAKIRERGWILHEEGEYRMWYTGYDGSKTGRRMLGYATSSDGVQWRRHPDNPLRPDLWIEDVTIVKDAGLYHMFAEGENDIAHYLTSTDRIHWVSYGAMDIRRKDGSRIAPGPRGTPAVWLENGVWNLFYERNDAGIWLARSQDRKVWTNVQDEPVMTPGPQLCDSHAIAVNQIVKHGGRYYAYYHGADAKDWKRWSTCVASSPDLLHWTKFAGNPIIANNESSGILVSTPEGPVLFTMHDVVRRHLPLRSAK